MAGLTEDNMSVADVYDLGALALQQNYRIGLDEIAELRLFANNNEEKIMRAAIDWDRFAEELKKKAGSIGLLEPHTGTAG